MADDSNYSKLQAILDEAKKDLHNLKTSYDSSLIELKEEIAYLREQMMAQGNMLENTLDYASRLEKQVKELDHTVKKIH